MIEVHASNLSDFQALVETCDSHYRENRNIFSGNEFRERRSKFSSFMKNFHESSGTLTPAVKAKIESLAEEDTILLMTAHQPNLFPYSGVIRKATLLFMLQEELERRLGVKVVNFYGIADQDFVDDRWVKSSILPSITKRDGSLVLNSSLPEKIMPKFLSKPSREVMNKWKNDIKSWIRDSTSAIRSYYSGSEGEIWKWNAQKDILDDNFELFWELTEKAHEKSKSYADFNAFFVSNVVNGAWKKDTVFVRFSDCQQIFAEEFNFLLKNFEGYSSSLKEVTQIEHDSKNLRGVSLLEHNYLPFWYHCECGSKVRLTPRLEGDFLFGHGRCVGCGKEFDLNLGYKDNPDIGAIASKISAKAVPMILVFSRGLGLTCYVGGVGGKQYLIEAGYIANKLGIKMPAITYWRPRDIYTSISHFETLIEYERITGSYDVDEWSNEVKTLQLKINNICSDINNLEIEKNIHVEKLRSKLDVEMSEKEIKDISIKINKFKKESNLSVLQYQLLELKNIPKFMGVMPSIIDYAINIGLKETDDQWCDHLISNGSLSSDVFMSSILDKFVDVKLRYLFEHLSNISVNRGEAEEYDLT